MKRVHHEGYEMILLETNVDDYQRMKIKKRKLTRKESKPKYTKSDKVNDKFHRWHKKGIKRYNKFVQIVKSYKEIAKSKELEIELKSIYAKLCGKGKGTYDGNEETNNIDSDSEDDGIEGLDGFAWDININNVSRIETV